MHACVLSCPTLCDHMDCSPPGPSAHVKLSRQEHWSEMLFLPPEDLPAAGIKPTFCVCPALAGQFFSTLPPEMPMSKCYISRKTTDRMCVCLWTSRVLLACPWGLEHRGGEELLMILPI